MAELLTAKYDADKLPEGKLRLFLYSIYRTLKYPCLIANNWTE